MRESCKYGSVRGANSNGGPYRNRREFITLLGGAALRGRSRRARSSAERMRRIGVLIGSAESDPESVPRVTAFERGLTELGWVSGRNVLSATTSCPLAHRSMRVFFPTLRPISNPRDASRRLFPRRDLSR